MEKDKQLIKFQLENCRDCFWGDGSKVGTGKPCCTKPTPPEMRAVEMICLSRKER